VLQGGLHHLVVVGDAVACQGGDDDGGDARPELLGGKAAVLLLLGAQKGDGLVAQLLDVLLVGAELVVGRRRLKRQQERTEHGQQADRSQGRSHGVILLGVAGYDRRNSCALQSGCRRRPAGRKRPAYRNKPGKPGCPVTTPARGALSSARFTGLVSVGR